MVREEINEKTAYIQARSFLARTVEVNGKECQAEGEAKWSKEKLHLDNARKLRGIYFIDPEDKEFKETIKNARKKLETSVAPAMSCKIMKKNCGSCGSSKVRTKLACILEVDESTRMRMGNSIPSNHEDHIAGKGENSLQHYNLVHKFIPVPQAMKIPAAKAAVDKEWEKLEKISAWNLAKAKSKKKVIDEARTSGATVHFASLMDICHLKSVELETKHQKYKGRVVVRGDTTRNPKLRSNRVSWLDKIFLCIFINLTDTYKTGESFFFFIFFMLTFFTCSRRNVGSRKGRCT